jgi:hypothetical protein
LTQTIDRPTPTGQHSTPTDRVLTATLVVAPLLYLAADTMYAMNGWTDATAGVLHVLGATAYGLVVLRVATWLPRSSALAAWLFVTAVAGSIGNAAYGFDAIHQSLGDTALVDGTGAATLIKPFGLLFPISLALAAWGLQQLHHRWEARFVLLAAVAWPVAHIANLGPLAVATNVVLVIALGSLAWRRIAVDASAA